MKKLLLGLLLIVGIIGCGKGEEKKEAEKASATPDKKVLIVGTNAQYKPFEYVGDNGELIGFDIELMKTIGEELGYEIEWKDMSFDSLIGALKVGKIDAIIAGMTPTEEREKSVDFSDIYYNTSQTLVKVKENTTINSEADLDGKKVIVQLGTIQEEKAKTIKGAKVISMEDIPAMIIALKNGKGDAVVIENIVAYEYLKQNPDLEIFHTFKDEVGGSAIALPKGSDKLEAINDILKKVKENGKYDELMNKYIKGE